MQHSAGLRALVTNNFVRGGISGLGLLNLVAGTVELLSLFGPRTRDGGTPSVVPSGYRNPADTRAEP